MVFPSSVAVGAAVRRFSRNSCCVLIADSVSGQL